MVCQQEYIISLGASYLNYGVMQVKDSCASPGGLTICGLACLERGGVRASMMEAVKAATERAEAIKPSPTK